jgi:quercetin dioxygenase-like cupin family protein
MYNSHHQLVYNQIVDGIKIKVMTKDDSAVMTEFELQKGTRLPEHIHTADHSAYLLKGRIRIVADGLTSEFAQGDSWCIKKNICHTTEALEDSLVLEVFELDSEDFKKLQLAAVSEVLV